MFPSREERALTRKATNKYPNHKTKFLTPEKRQVVTEADPQPVLFWPMWKGAGSDHDSLFSCLYGPWNWMKDQAMSQCCLLPSLQRIGALAFDLLLPFLVSCLVMLIWYQCLGHNIAASVVAAVLSHQQRSGTVTGKSSCKNFLKMGRKLSHPPHPLLSQKNTCNLN